ncbi:MAG: hypothetical protein H6711_03495 [Myxococcales bacterium]|nr:hypothetical protein [Myxococcales bacterium]
MRSIQRAPLLTPAYLLLVGALACSGGETGDDSSATQASSITGLTSATAAATSTASAASDASGSGGTSGGSSDSGGSTSGDASASAGTTGSPGSGGDSGFCKEQCADDNDCLKGGQDDGHRCKSGICYPDNIENYAPFCLEDEICVLGMFNGGFLCNSADNCPGVYVCAAVDGYPRPGVCARAVDAMGECPSPGYIKASKPLVGGGEAVLCTHDSTCKPELGDVTLNGCTLANYCGTNEDCAAFGKFYGTTTCDAQHHCVCTEDADCAGVANAPHCIAGTCGCLEDRECPGTPGADACVDGRCGCSSARTCPPDKTYDGTEIVCE